MIFGCRVLNIVELPGEVCFEAENLKYNHTLLESTRLYYVDRSFIVKCIKTYLK